jgi:hypothetical protein
MAIIKLKDCLPDRLVEKKCGHGETNAKTGCTPEDEKKTVSFSAPPMSLPTSLADLRASRKDKEPSDMSEKERIKEVSKHTKTIKALTPKVGKFKKIKKQISNKLNKIYDTAHESGLKKYGSEDKFPEDYPDSDPKWAPAIDKLYKEKEEKTKDSGDMFNDLRKAEERVDELKYKDPPNNRKSEIKKRKGGGKMEKLDDAGYRNFEWNKENMSDDSQEDALDANYKQNQLAKLSRKEKKIAYDHIASWKSIGGYDPDDKIPDEYQNERDEYMTKLANSVMKTPPPKSISRGMTLKPDSPVLKKLIEQYSTVGASVKMDFTQGFSASAKASSGFADTGEDAVGFHITIKPNSTGQLRGVHIDGITNDPDYEEYAGDGNSPSGVSYKNQYSRLSTYKGEQEVVRSSESSASVVDFIERRGKAPKDHPDFPNELVYYEVVLQEPDDLNEEFIHESRSKIKPYYSSNLAPKRMANIIQRYVDGLGDVFFAQPHERATKINLYSDKNLRKHIKTWWISKVYPGKKKYTERMSKRFISGERDKIIGKKLVAGNI